MAHLFATLTTLGITLHHHATTRLEDRDRDRERGASTIEIVFWAAGLLVLAGIVYAAINAYIAGKIAGIK